MLTRLFPEVLSYIMILAQESVLFDTASNEEGDDFDMDFPHKLPFEIVMSHVNSSIRTTTLHTARLWSSIRLDTATQGTRILLERTTAYLKRSNGHLLDLRIELNGVALSDSQLLSDENMSGQSSYSYWELHEAMEFIARESTRWRKLTIVAEDQGISDVCAGICGRLIEREGEFLTPELEFLSISVDYREDDMCGAKSVDDDSFWVTGTAASQQNRRQGYPRSNSINTSTTQKTVFQQHPKLSFLRLRGLAMYLFHLTLLPGLRILHLDQTKALPLSFHFFTSIVIACPALEHLSIYGDIVMPPTSGAAIPSVGDGRVHPQNHQIGHAEIAGTKSAKETVNMALYIPELRSLRLCGVSGSVYQVILSQLEAPKLMSLFLKDVQEHDLDALWEGALVNSACQGASIRFEGVRKDPPRSEFIPKLTFAQLRSLAINNSDFSTTLYQRLFRVFPCITEFASYSSIEVDNAPKLFARETASIPWPQLHSLTFIFDVDLDIDDEALEELVKQRKASGYPVNKLCIGVADLDVECATEIVRQETVIMMKNLDEIDIWPLDRQFVDVDDILF